MRYSALPCIRLSRIFVFAVTVTLTPAEYGDAGNYPLILTATNNVSHPVVISRSIRVILTIIGMELTHDTNTIVHPDDIITFNLTADTGMELDTTFDCFDVNGDNAAGRYSRVHHIPLLLEMNGTQSLDIFQIDFHTDGIFTCNFVAIGFESNFTTQIVFTVQYAVEQLECVPASLATDADYRTSIQPPAVSTQIDMVVRLTTELPAATNVSWSIDFGDGFVLESTEFISGADGRDLDLLAVIVIPHVYEQVGRFIVILKMWNLISSVQLVVHHSVYDIITDLAFTVEHISPTGEKTPPFGDSLIEGGKSLLL